MMKLSILLVVACIALVSAHKPPKYINYVPHAGVNCTGPVNGHGTSYLLNACIPFEGYALKFVLNGSNIESYYYWGAQNCSIPADGPYSSAVGSCFRFRQGYKTNPYFYASISVTRKAIKPPKHTLCLYMKSYYESNLRCKGDFNWSKYVTNGTSWLWSVDFSETLYCDRNNNALELLCNTTTSYCTTTAKDSDCDPFAQQLANLVSKCVGPNPRHSSSDSSSSDSSSSDSDDDSVESLHSNVVRETVDFPKILGGLHTPYSTPK